MRNHEPQRFSAASAVVAGHAVQYEEKNYYSIDGENDFEETEL